MILITSDNGLVTIISHQKLLNKSSFTLMGGSSYTFFSGVLPLIRLWEHLYNVCWTLYFRILTSLIMIDNYCRGRQLGGTRHDYPEHLSNSSITSSSKISFEGKLHNFIFRFTGNVWNLAVILRPRIARLSTSDYHLIRGQYSWRELIPFT